MRFRDARRQAGVSIAETMRRTGLSRTAVFEAQRPAHRVSYGTAIRLSRAVGVDPREIDEFRPIVEVGEPVAS